MLDHILIAGPEELQAEAERISLLDEPDREEAILELLQEIQFKQELLVWGESSDEDSWDPSTAEREADDEDSQDSFSW